MAPLWLTAARSGFHITNHISSMCTQTPVVACSESLSACRLLSHATASTSSHSSVCCSRELVQHCAMRWYTACRRSVARQHHATGLLISASGSSASYLSFTGKQVRNPRHRVFAVTAAHTLHYSASSSRSWNLTSVRPSSIAVTDA